MGPAVRPTQKPRGLLGGLIIATSVTVLVVAAVVMARSIVEQRGIGEGGTAPPSAAATAQPSGAATAAPAVSQPLPAPEGFTVVEVIADPIEVGAIGPEEALAVARATISNRVGQSPRLQLIRLATQEPDSYMNGFIGWMILSTDVPGHPHGPNPDAAAKLIVATYTWVFVSAEGEALDAVQVMYEAEHSIPPLPAD